MIPDFTSWFQTDQSLVSILRATLSESILTQVVGYSTSKDIWDYLRQNISKQSLANELASINASISNTDLVTYVLRGLGPDLPEIEGVGEASEKMKKSGADVLKKIVG
ncbi:unnamed protein product [Prunus armeniaca]